VLTCPLLTEKALAIGKEERNETTTVVFNYDVEHAFQDVRQLLRGFRWAVNSRTLAERVG
jgi:nitrate/nitrite-specific signal transduction histidine kinase